ncbi:iridoid synthase-like protein [Tanacetum coccineum]
MKKLGEFLSRMIISRRYAFGKMSISGNVPPFKVKGLWLFFGPEIPHFLKDECYNMELYEWTKVDPSDETQKKHVNQMIEYMERFEVYGNKYTWEHFWDASDATMLAEQHIWASVTEKAKNQAFNCTNGDVFTWKMLWRVPCDVFDVEFMPFNEKEIFDIAEFMKDKGQVWDRR